MLSDEISSIRGLKKERVAHIPSDQGLIFLYRPKATKSCSNAFHIPEPFGQGDHHAVDAVAQKQAQITPYIGHQSVYIIYDVLE